jgi:hypothetical protein
MFHTSAPPLGPESLLKRLLEITEQCEGNNTTRSISFFDNLYPSCVRANRIRAHESWRQMKNSLIIVNPLLRAISWLRTGSAHQKISQLVSRCFKSHSIHQILMYCLASIGTHHIDDAITICIPGFPIFASFSLRF